MVMHDGTIGHEPAPLAGIGEPQREVDVLVVGRHERRVETVNRLEG